MAAETVEGFMFVLRCSFVFENLTCQAFLHAGEGVVGMGIGGDSR